MKLRSKLLLILSSLAVSGTALAAMPVDQFKFFDMQRMITDGYQFPNAGQTAQNATQETSRKAERNDTHQTVATKTPDNKNPMPM
jgi:Skp family chaperone for outer membrane proteins